MFTRARIVVFCDGDFWHGHNWALRGIPSLKEELASYSDFWKEKILRNIDRDKKNTAALVNSNWTVIRFWESEIRSNVDQCAKKVEQEYRRKTEV